MGTVFDDPNREAVGLDPAWVEGTGGPVEAPKTDAGAGGGDELDSMTKDELLDYAQQLGASPANAAMTKDELKASIRAKEAAG